MIKALFLDMDETLCDTTRANNEALSLLADHMRALYGQNFDATRFAGGYLNGIYRNWSELETIRYLAIVETEGEETFRIQLIIDLVTKQGFAKPDRDTATEIQRKFDKDRLAHFHFYPGMVDFLTEAREKYTLVVITNGPEHSQLPKIDTVKLTNYVDHIIVGGQEPEQKPAKSIFEKALKLANCKAHEAIHVGDSFAADITGAYNSGIPSIWVKHDQSLSLDSDVQPNHMVAHPRDIPEFIRNIQT